MSEQEKREYAEKVAEAVRAACLNCFTYQNAPAAQAIKALHLPGIVVQVKG
jgi:hypothetical protein